MDLRARLDKSYGRGIFGFSDISIEKANTAKEKYANDVNLENIVLLIDDTAFESAKYGILITFDGLYIGESFEKPLYFPFEKIDSIYMKQNLLLRSLYINNKKVRSFAQPKYDDLKDVFKEIQSYLNKNDSNENFAAIKNQPNDIDMNSDIGEVIDINRTTDSNILSNDIINNQASNSAAIQEEEINSNNESNVVENTISTIAIKIVQSYFRTLFIQSFDFKTRTSNAWLYIFSVINVFIIIKTFEDALAFIMEPDTSPITVIKLIIFCLCVVSSFSIIVRRLHDINKPGWLLIAGIVFPPFLIVLGFMFLLPGTVGENKYGKDPRSLPYWYLR